MKIPANIVYLLLLLCTTHSFAQNKPFIDITTLGANPDGTTNNTTIINNAITTCAQNGGGTITFPQGTYITGTIYLKSNVSLTLEKDAVIQGTTNINEYHPLIPYSNLSKYNTVSNTGTNANSAFDTIWAKALIIGLNVSNVTISGEGIIDGEHVFNAQGEEGMRGPHTILLANCKNITFQNITIEKAANYAILGYDLQHVSFQNICIKEGWDGIHIRGGKAISIKNCTFETGDDAIAGGYWDQFEITGCSINSSCNGIRVIMPVANFSITQSTFTGPGKYPHRTSGTQHRTNMLTGIYIQPGGWGPAKGDLNNIRIANLKMTNMGSPVIFELNGENNASNITVADITATGMNGPMSAHSNAAGVFKNVSFNNLSIHFLTTTAPWAFYLDNIRHLHMKTLQLYSKGIAKDAIEMEHVMDAQSENVQMLKE